MTRAFNVSHKASAGSEYSLHRSEPAGFRDIGVSPRDERFRNHSRSVFVVRSTPDCRCVATDGVDSAHFVLGYN